MCYFKILALKQKYNVDIYIHREEAAYLMSGKSPLISGTNKGLKILTTLIKKPIECFSCYEPVKPDIIISEDRYFLEHLGINAYHAMPCKS